MCVCVCVCVRACVCVCMYEKLNRLNRSIIHASREQKDWALTVYLWEQFQVLAAHMAQTQLWVLQQFWVYYPRPTCMIIIIEMGKGESLPIRAANIITEPKITAGQWTFSLRWLAKKISSRTHSNVHQIHTDMKKMADLLRKRVS